VGRKPSCCRKPDFDRLFGEPSVRRELGDYRHRGAQGATRDLIEAIRAEGADALHGAEVLDIGGGVGVIGHELVASGASRLTAIDLSNNYLAAARDEATDRGYADRAVFRFGDFVDLAPELDDADIVTLDSVLCCYRDWRSLVGASTAKARRLYGLVYPVDRPWTRAASVLGNFALRMFRSDFRFHIHPDRAVDRLIRSAGFERRYRRGGLIWQTVLYRRIADA
jgi:predicted TPR repeat methyltransferase